jgi:hypothetical protein
MPALMRPRRLDVVKLGAVVALALAGMMALVWDVVKDIETQEVEH